MQLAGLCSARPGRRRIRLLGVMLSLSLLGTSNLLAIYRDYREVRGRIRWSPIGGDQVTLSERTYERALDELPGMGRVGYFQQRTGIRTAWDRVWPFQLAQYILAPRIVTWNECQDFNILDTDNGIRVIRRHEALPWTLQR